MRVPNGRWRLLALLLALTLFAAACGDDDEEETGSGSASAPVDEDAGSATTAPTEEGAGAEGGVTCEGLAIAFFGALTGDAANLGISIKQGAELAVNQFNEANPDCQVEFKTFDSQGSPDQAPALAQEAAQDESIVGIVGPAFSGESRAANPIFEEVGLPIVTPSATGADLSEQGWDVFHRALGNDALQGPAAARYVAETLKATKVAVIDDASEYGKGIADAVRETLAGTDAEVVLNQSIDPTAQDYASTVNAVRSAAPDAIFYGGYYEAAGRLAKQLRDAGVESTFVSGDGAKDPGFVEAAGESAAEGAILTCPCAPTPEDFEAAYQEAFGETAGTYASEAYDSANLFLEAIKAGNTDRESINTFLDEVQYEGITKNFSFDEKGEVASETIYVFKVEGGEIVDAGTVQ